MNYWHMQLHPNDINWDREKEVLENKNLIGVGDIEQENLQIKQFKKSIEIEDIILIRKGKIPVALVEVTGELEDIGENKFDELDWFRYRRKVKILDFAKEQDLFPQSIGTLKKLISKNSKSYKYIENWHKKLLPSFFKSKLGIKLKKIYVKDYKILKDFNISFEYKNVIQPIIVMAGINGSGKTSVLDCINQFLSYIKDKDDDDSFIEFEKYDYALNNHRIEIINYTNSFNVKYIDNRKTIETTHLSNFFKKNIVYFSTGTNLKNIKEFLPKYIGELIYKKDIKASDAHEKIRTFINNIFKDLNVLIEFDSRDSEGNIYFRNTNGERFSIDEISAGEKTLLSKVLYLYLKDIKDSVILIDEPELSLHPAWQNKILKLYETFAKSNNCQMIIATHSPHIIGSAKKEYLRLLVMEDDQIKVVDNFSHSYGLEFNQILTNVMDVKYLRTPDVAEELSKIKKKIQNNEFDDSEFKKSWKYLESIFGENYLDLKLLKLEIAARKKNV